MRTKPVQRDGGTARQPYDTARARELLARTVDLPGSKHDLAAALTEYRHALAALAAGAKDGTGPPTI